MSKYFFPLLRANERVNQCVIGAIENRVFMKELHKHIKRVHWTFENALNIKDVNSCEQKEPI